MILALLALAHGACTVIDDVEAYLPAGPVAGQTLVLDGDRIAAIGASPAGLVRSGEAVTFKGASCTRIDGAGRPVTPGIIAVDTQLGLVEVSLEEGSRDDNPENDDAIRGALYAADAYDPYSSLIPVQRVEGVTHAIITPSGGGLVSGHAAAVQLSGASQAETVLARQVAVAVGLPSRSRAEGMHQLRELVADVRSVAKDPAAFEGNRRRALSHGLSALDLQGLIPAVRGEVPLLIDAHRSADIEALIRLQSELGLRFVIRGASEGWRVADALASAKIPVLVDPMEDGVEGFDRIGATDANAARLVAAGVPVMFQGEGSHNLRLLRFRAGNAVRGGLDHDAAVRSLTEVPAQVFGLAGHGRLEAGAFADVVLWSGDPLEVTTRAREVWVAGRQLPRESRQTVLRDRYLKR